MRIIPRSLLLSTLALWIATPAAAQEPRDLAAAAGRWMTYGGSPARTAASASPGLRGPIAEAWVHQVEGGIVGEPLVWDGICVLELDLGNGERALRGIDLASGERLTSQDTFVTSPLAMEPSLWQSDVCFRDSEQSLAGVRLWKGTAFPRWNHASDQPLGPPLFVDGAVYVCEGDSLVRLRFGEEGEVWRSQGPYRGRVSLRGDKLLALQSDVHGRFYAVELSSESGRELRKVFVGRGQEQLGHGSQVVPTLAIYDEAWGVSLPPPLSLHPEGQTHGVFVDPNAEEPLKRVPLLASSGGWSLLPALMFEEGVAGCIVRHEREAPVLWRFTDLTVRKALALANAESNPGFARHDAGVTVLADTVYVGARAFDRSTLEVLWRNAGSAERTSRAIPARDSVLYVRGGKELVCLRQAFVVMEEIERARSIPDSESNRSTWRGLVVVEPGSLKVGANPLRPGVVELFQQEARIEVRAPKEADTHRFRTAEVLAVLDESDAPLWTSNGGRLVEAYRVLALERRKQTLNTLAVQAKKHYDADLVESLLERARAAGAVSEALDELPAWIEQRRAGPEISKSVVTKREIEVLLAEAQRAEASPETAALDFYGRCMETADLYWRVEALETLLRENPLDPEALIHVRNLVPAEVRPPEEEFKNGLDWLRFVRAAAQTTVKIYTPARDTAGEDSTSSPSRKKRRKDRNAPKSDPKLTFAQNKLAEASAGWSGELIAFESEHLLVVTSLPEPGAVARTLAHGDLVCDSLESMFLQQDAVPAVRNLRAKEPLVIYLCATRDEYVEISLRARGGRKGGAPIEHTAGRYDPAANVTRVFLSSSDPAGQERLLRTYTHELTHHWLEVHCPIWRRHEPRSGGRAPGYWIVEGFASMVEDFAFDTELRRWSPQRSRSRRLDLLAHSSASQQIPWESLFTLSQWERNSMKTSSEEQVPSSIRLSYSRKTSETGLFYAQAAATAHYLYAAEAGA